MSKSQDTPPSKETTPLVPQGAAFFPVNAVKPTRNWAFVLVPGFTLLAFSSAVEPLRIANQLSQRPLYRWWVYSETGGLVPSSSGVDINSEPLPAAFERSAMLLVCGGNRPQAAKAGPVVHSVLRHHRFGGTTGGICTGAIALAKAGLLENRRFTMHWENQPGFVEEFPDLSPTGNRYEIDNDIMTCGGGAAATNMMLSCIAQDYGDEFASMVSEMCLRNVAASGNTAQRSSISAMMSVRNPIVSEVVRLMQQNVEDPLTMDAISRTTNYSRRRLERLFTHCLGESPRKFYVGLRLGHARNLLATTDLPLIEIATATGFSSVALFSRRFRDRFGFPPTKLRSEYGKR